jgi:hypothetical protein
LLTECAKFDPDIVAKIKGQLRAGKSVVITSGLLRALQGRGIEDIVEVQYTDRKVLAHEYSGGFGAGNGRNIGGETNADVLFPEIVFSRTTPGRSCAPWPTATAIRSCSWTGIPRASFTSGRCRTISTTFTRCPRPVTSAIKNYVMRGFPVRLDGPGQVALFAYDNTRSSSNPICPPKPT